MSHIPPSPAARPVCDWSCVTASPEETERLGEILGRTCSPPAVLALTGNLGAGKTRLTKGVATGLGINPALVSSPTFSLVHEYEGRFPLFHFDTYRLRNLDEFIDLGFDEYLAATGLCLIEWADKVSPLLPPDRLQVFIQASGPTERTFHWNPTGSGAGAWLMRIRTSWESIEPASPA